MLYYMLFFYFFLRFRTMFLEIGNEIVCKRLFINGSINNNIVLIAQMFYTITFYYIIIINDFYLLSILSSICTPGTDSGSLWAQASLTIF